MNITQEIQQLTENPVLRGGKNSGSSSPVPTVPAIRLDSVSIRGQFKTLKKALNALVPQLVEARETLDLAAPYLEQMQSVLSQRGSERKSIQQKGKLPTRKHFVSEFARKAGYSVRQVTNVIRDYRAGGAGKQPGKAKSPSCKPMLVNLLEWLELYGDKLPVVLVDVCRNADAVLAGKRSLRQWRGHDQQLQEASRRATAIQADEEGLPSAHVASYVM